MLILYGCQIIAIEPIWSVYLESGYNLLPCFYAVPHIINSTCQTVVFKSVCPKKVSGKGCHFNILYVLTNVYLMVF